ncbi:MAG: MFS transporter [Actinomycetota bacterium]
MEAERSHLLTAPFVRIWLATLGAFASFGMLVLALPLYTKDVLDRGSVGIGVAMGAASLTSIMFSTLAGRFADRRGRRPLLLAGACVMAACYLALALSPGLAGVVVVRLIAGAAEATFVVGAYTVIADIAPDDRRGEAMSLVTLASYLGLTIGPVLADLVLGGHRFAAVWLVSTGLVLSSVALISTFHETKPHVDETASSSWLPPRGALLPGLLVLLGLLGFGGFVTFAALYGRDLGIDRPGLVFALFGGVICLVRAFGRKLPDALGAGRMLMLSFLTLGAGLATIGGWQTTTGLLAGTVVFAAGQALMYPSAVLLAMESTTTAERSATVGTVGAFVDVAIGLGAFTLGGVAAVWGYGGAFIVASLVALSGLLALVPLRPFGRIPAEEGVP